MSRALPSLVLFDLDGVLVRYDRAARVRHLAAGTGRSNADVHAALFGSGLEDRFDAGAILADAYLEELGARLGTRVDRQLWADARAIAMQVEPGLPAWLAALAARCTLAMLTNNGALLVELLPDLVPDLTAPFAGRLLCSGQFGVRKPDPRVYTAAVERLGHPAATTLFLDDVAANVDGARRAGLQAAQVPDPAALPRLLTALGLD